MSQAPAVLAAGPPGTTRRAAPGSEFTPLLRTVRQRGLLERRTRWYAAAIGSNALAFAAVVSAVVVIGNHWWNLLLAPVLAVVSARTAFIGHDAGHGQITGSRKAGRVIGLLHGNLLLGMSYAWWNDKHNRHHANPNHIDKDPDVAADVLVWTQRQAAGRVGFRCWLTRNQAWLFFPLTLLEGIALKAHGFRHLRHQPRRERAVEAALLTLHAAAYTGLVFTVMSPWTALCFVAVHQALFGLHLGLAFAPNHKGMEMPDPEAEPWGHLRRQVLTSRNIRGGPVTDFLLGGLNYQIEHHLFPSMPRPSLRRARPLVRAHCQARGIPYAETGLVDSYRQALGYMHEVGEPLRAGGLQGRRRCRVPGRCAAGS